MIRPLIFLLLALLIYFAGRRWWIDREARKLGDVFDEIPNAIPYFPKEKDYGDLSPQLREQLDAISPSAAASSTGARPCRVTTRSGEEFSCVFIADAQRYIDNVGQWPDDMSDTDDEPTSIAIEDVVRIEESPYRVPEHVVAQILEYHRYDRGGMRFIATFSDGQRWRYRDNGYAEFLSAPAGLTFADAIDIAEDDGSEKLPRGRALQSRWCLYGHGIPPKNVQIFKQ